MASPTSPTGPPRQETLSSVMSDDAIPETDPNTVSLSIPERAPTPAKTIEN